QAGGDVAAHEGRYYIMGAPKWPPNPLMPGPRRPTRGGPRRWAAAWSELAARPVALHPQRLIVAAVVPARLVVGGDPVSVGRPDAGHPRVVRVGLRHPLIAPVAGLPAAPRGDEDDLGNDHDRPLLTSPVVVVRG